MAATQPFAATSLGITVAATASALTAVALPTGTDTKAAGNSVRIVNEGPNICFIALGASTVLATLPTATGVTTCVPVLPSTDIVLSRAPGTDLFISTICRAAGTSTLTVQVGEGQ